MGTAKLLREGEPHDDTGSVCPAIVPDEINVSKGGNGLRSAVRVKVHEIIEPGATALISGQHDERGQSRSVQHNSCASVLHLLGNGTALLRVIVRGLKPPSTTITLVCIGIACRCVY